VLLNTHEHTQGYTDNREGHAVVYVVSRKPPAVKAQVQFQTSFM